MKTDRFTDIIRRKLESIRPEFTDKDWERMQATLTDANLSQPNAPNPNHPFSGGVWTSGKSWLLAAASVSTVVLISYSMWQQREINHLRQTIGQLHPKSINQSAPTRLNPGLTEQTRPDLAHSDKNISASQPQEVTTVPNRNEGQSVRPDTVYVTRYVPVPSRKSPDIRPEAQLSQRVDTPAEQGQALEMATPSSANPRQSTTLTHNTQPESNAVSSTPSVAQNTENESVKIDKSINPLTGMGNSVSQNSSRRIKKRTDTSPVTSIDRANKVATNSGAAANASANTNVAVTESTDQAASSTPVNKTSATYELASGLPLSLGNKNWSAALAQYAKRMRPAKPPVVVEPAKVPAVVEQAPASQPVQRVATRFRVGAGGEVASHLWSAGVFTEVLFGKHLALTVGLSQATYLNTFMNDDDFNNRTKRDFRNEFGRGIDPWRDIVNIDTRQQRTQIPISIGYRIPLTRTLTLLPTVGTYFTLTNSEDITFYCRKPMLFPQQPPRGFEELSTSRKQSVDLVNGLALGAGLEWQRNHWVVQAIPVLTIATQTDPKIIQTDLNWQKNSTLGLRARLLYQF